MLHPSVFYKRDVQTSAVVYLDDFLCVAPLEELGLVYASPTHVKDLKSTMHRGGTTREIFEQVGSQRGGGAHRDSEPKPLVALKEESAMQQGSAAIPR